MPVKKDRRRVQRKIKKEVVISIRLPERWLEMIDFSAALSRRSRSDFLRYKVIEPWLIETASDNLVQDFPD